MSSRGGSWTFVTCWGAWGRYEHPGPMSEVDRLGSGRVASIKARYRKAATPYLKPLCGGRALISDIGRGSSPSKKGLFLMPGAKRVLGLTTAYSTPARPHITRNQEEGEVAGWALGS